MTESTSCITATPKEFVNFIHAHTVGKIVGSTQVKIIDVETGEELGHGKLGEVGFHPPIPFEPITDARDRS